MSVALELNERIKAGHFSDPNAKKEDREQAEDQMSVICALLSSSNSDRKEKFEKKIATLPPAQRQVEFEKYKQEVVNYSRQYLGDPETKSPNGKQIEQGVMKRKESTNTQTDWMYIGLMEDANKAGVSFARPGMELPWATSVVDQKKYQDLKKKANKKGFDKLEGGEKLDIMKFEADQKAKTQPQPQFQQQVQPQYQPAYEPQPMSLATLQVPRRVSF